MSERPKCRRCGGPLDVWHDPETGKVEWSCQNLVNQQTLVSDYEFWKMWNNLSGDDVVRLEKLLEEKK